ncbi:MAG: YggS family pyridoxal phosphate-dependent enzyme [Nocardioides sp.]
MTGDDRTRRAELRANLTRVQGRVAAACAGANRSLESVAVLVVTKFFPAADVRLLAELGVTDVGESRHPEAADKWAACGDLDLGWHFIGGLQSNKARVVASYADVVHSVDRLKLVSPLARGVVESRRTSPLRCLVQVALDQPASAGQRAGATAAELPRLAAAVASSAELTLGGLMAIAPLAEEPRAAFDRLAEIRASFLVDHPRATWLSAGMSDDLEHAIAAGATHVRVGRSVLGLRPQVQYGHH